MKESHDRIDQDFKSENTRLINVEKERIVDTKVTLRVLDVESENNIEVSKYNSVHKYKLRELLRVHKQNRNKRSEEWNSKVGRDRELAANDDAEESNSSSVQSKSKDHSRKGSDSNINANMRNQKANADDDNDIAKLQAKRDQQTSQAQDTLKKLETGLIELKKKQETALYALKQTHLEAQQQLSENFVNEFTEMEFTHKVDIKRLIEDCEAEIKDALKIQERESVMEGNIREAETKALIERKVLNALLDTFIDGVISIDPRGFIKRFKYYKNNIVPLLKKCLVIHPKNCLAEMPILNT